jgi:hypothetical protein
MTGVLGRTLHQLEDERGFLVQESERLQVALGRLRAERRSRPRRYRRGDPRNTLVSESGNRAGIVARLAEITTELRRVNIQIKGERRRLTTMLAEGSPRPRTSFQYMVALYRLFNDAVPPEQRSEDEQALMRRTRDFVIAGRMDHG